MLILAKRKFSYCNFVSGSSFTSCWLAINEYRLPSRGVCLSLVNTTAPLLLSGKTEFCKLKLNKSQIFHVFY